MTAYPCPNPVCTHTFTSADVQAGAVTCPACGKVFRFRAGPRPPEPQAPPPLAQLATPESIFDVAGAHRSLSAGGARRGARSRNYYLLLGAGIILTMGVALAGILALKAVLGTSDNRVVPVDKTRVIVGNARNQKNLEEKAFKLILAEKDWLPDSDLRKRLGAVTAWKSADRDGWFAVWVRDYGPVRPRQAELLRTGIDKLEQYFDGALELAENAEPARLSEVEGQRLLFKGQRHAQSWWGYMYTAAHDGFGYWLFVAAPAKEEAEDLFAKELQRSDLGFFVATDRKGWREEPPKVESFATVNGALTVTVPEGMFEKHPAKNQDERGQLYLFAKYKKELDNRKYADILIVALDKKKDLQEAMKFAKKDLEQKKQEESKDYKLEVAGEGSDHSELGVSGPVGNRPGRTAEYKLLRGAAPAKYWLVAVAQEPDHAYVIRCESNWEHRQIWRTDFQELLHSVTFQR